MRPVIFRRKFLFCEPVFLVMELFVDMIWTDRFSQTDSPESEAKQFKETVLNLIDHPEEFADQDELLLNNGEGKPTGEDLAVSVAQRAGAGLWPQPVSSSLMGSPELLPSLGDARPNLEVPKLGIPRIHPPPGMG